MNEKKHQYNKTRARISTAMLFLINGAIFASWVPHIPYVQEKLGLSEGSLGLVLVNISLGSIVAMPLAGLVATKIGSRIVTLTASFLFLLTAPLLVIAPSVPVLTVTMIFFGAFCGSMDVGMNSMAVAIEKSYEKPIMSSFHGIFSVGGLVGSALASYLLFQEVPPFTHLIAVSLVSIVALLIVSPFIKIPPAVREKANTKFVLPKGPLVSLGLLVLFCLLCEGAVTDWSTVFMKKILGLPPGQAALGFTCFSLTMTIGRFGGDYLIKKLDRITILRLSSLLAAGGMIIVVSILSPVMALIGFGLLGLGLANIVPILFSLAGNIIDTEAERAVAAVATCGYVGFLGGPPLIGFIAELTSLRISMATLILMILAVTISAGMLKKITENNITSS